MSIRNDKYAGLGGSYGDPRNDPFTQRMMREQQEMMFRHLAMSPQFSSQQIAQSLMPEQRDNPVLLLLCDG